MMRPSPMSHVKIIALRQNMEKIISELHEEGVIHIKKSSIQNFEKEKELSPYAEIVEQLLRIESILQMVKPQKTHTKQIAKSTEKLVQTAKKIDVDKQLQEIQSELDKLKNEHDSLIERRKQLEFFRDFHFDFSELHSNLLTFFAGLVPTKKLTEIKARFSRISSHHNLITKKYSKEQSIIIVAVENKFASQFKDYLLTQSFKELDITIEGTPKEFTNKINQRLAIVRDKLKQLNAEINRISKIHWDNLQYLKEALTIEKERHEISSRFGRTQELFAVEGWILKDNLSKLEEALKNVVGGKFILTADDAHEDFPIHLKNPKVLSPFQFMIEFVSLPKPHDFDPTMIFAILFPIFYGAMLGDAGYGLMSFFVASFIVSKTSPKGLLNPIGQVWRFCSIPTLVFGIAYDEFFGFSHSKILGQYLYTGLERMHAIEVLLPATILLGAAMIALAFFFGFLNALHEKHYWHALAKLGWTGVVLSGTILIPGILFNVFDEGTITIAGIVFIGSVLPILKEEGIMGLIEIPSVAGNILSFSRILAVGLASVIVAIILNDLLFPSLDQGLLLILTLPLFLFGHLFNIVLGMFESLVQGARLNYVELFSKFYEGGGERFTPFQVVRTYTKRR